MLIVNMLQRDLVIIPDFSYSVQALVASQCGTSMPPFIKVPAQTQCRERSEMLRPHWYGWGVHHTLAFHLIFSSNVDHAGNDPSHISQPTWADGGTSFCDGLSSHLCGRILLSGIHVFIRRVIRATNSGGGSGVCGLNFCIRLRGVTAGGIRWQVQSFVVIASSSFKNVYPDI